ncbi:hypothetical protein [Denitratisoma oestradiolicum]|uniref:Uncharacterized protein n=1 Tax=Denitratisoma oestradiolicum TaxID=311182 RepID=A0A6S6XWE5_9PROT|nr:hypothetical protein [Denitratisoma oestradiolicum]TWO81369.1 hypothetical protein CBW56_04455 [Denitratisoma oestradiolicum]CAB1368563.1 protein of unknown function [Denitratisoma oestradiolicum]
MAELTRAQADLMDAFLLDALRKAEALLSQLQSHPDLAVHIVQQDNFGDVLTRTRAAQATFASAPRLGATSPDTIGAKACHINIKSAAPELLAVDAVLANLPLLTVAVNLLGTALEVTTRPDATDASVGAALMEALAITRSDLAKLESHP